jgi:hypothetical protein
MQKKDERHYGRDKQMHEEEMKEYQRFLAKTA